MSESLNIAINKWNLCIGKKPLENSQILLTFKNKTGIHVGNATFKENKYFYIVDSEKAYFEEEYNNPIAWMDIPKPYSYEKRFCKMCGCDIAPEYTNYNNYDEDGFCSMCGDYVCEENLFEDYDNAEDRFVECSEEDFKLYIEQFEIEN